MGDKTGIEWTDATWNPTTGCDKVSPGCDRCYAMTLAPRLKAMGSPHYQLDGNPETSGPGFGYQEHPDALDKPLRWTRPRRIFVNSMSDLFHQDATPDFIARVFAVMALSPQHTFQVLTKRPGKMRSLLTSFPFSVAVMDHAWTMAHREQEGIRVAPAAAQAYIQQVQDAVHSGGPGVPWPLPNVWLGTSVEDQKRADLRIPQLLATPAARRFLSAEPLLGHVALGDTTGLDWVIVGGESGTGARPMNPDWARALRDQCISTGVPFLFKQWGEWTPDEHPGSPHTYVTAGPDPGLPFPLMSAMMWRTGKKAAGRVLDGRTWDQYPEETA